MVREHDAVMERTMFGRTIFGAVSLAALAFATPSANAQLVPADPSTNSVLIDLGAIDGAAPTVSGRGMTGVGTGILGTMPGTGTSGGQLLLPPQSAPSSRLMGPDGRPLREAALPPAVPRATQPRAAAPKAAPQPPRIASAPQPARPEAARPETTRPTLPPVALPSMPAPAAPTPPKDGGPIALNSPTPPPTVAPAPAPDIPSMQVVGPDAAPKSAAPGSQAAVSPQAPAAQPKAAPAQSQSQAKAPPASKGPTPAPSVAPPPPPDAPSAPAAKSAPQAKPKAEQQAALPAPRPSAGAPKGATPQGIDVLFASGTADLNNDAKAALDKLAENLKSDEKSRLQLLAYATEDSPSKSRRLSLSRALAVRSHLIAKGIRSTRIDVRALGDQVPGGEPNRVDLQITDR